MNTSSTNSISRRFYVQDSSSVKYYLNKYREHLVQQENNYRRALKEKQNETETQ